MDVVQKPFINMPSGADVPPIVAIIWTRNSLIQTLLYVILTYNVITDSIPSYAAGTPYHAGE